MRQRVTNFLLMFVFTLWTAIAFGQGSTTSGMNGKVVGNNGEILPGATVVVKHIPTGSQYAAITNAQGLYFLPNMNVGGPYMVTISFVGYEKQERSNIYLTLGQNFQLNANLSEQATDLGEVNVIVKRKDIFDGNRTGAETVIDEQSLAIAPTISRSLNDFVRFTPQVSIMGSGISIAGTNNRYNSVLVDGAVNNDVFGLAASGTNGGQIGISPISLDAIEQFQVVLAPYDVRQGGFAGGGINAVTRNGTNNFEGSVYWVTRNENLAGKTPTNNPDIERVKLDKFGANTYGVRVGGPIVKDKLFFFFNAEIQRDETPKPFNFDDYTGTTQNMDSVQMVIDKLKNDFGYDPGTFTNNKQITNSNKFLLRMDYNISANHKLTLRHSFVDGRSIYGSASSKTSLNFENNWINFNSRTNSTALELKSRVGDNMANSLIIAYNAVRDDRDGNGTDFPTITLRDGSGYFNIGTEPFSTGNELNQDVLTITNNFNLYLGKHTLTFGTHNEFYKMYNLFIRQNYGVYTWNSVKSFLDGANANSYTRSYSLVDDVTGDGSKAAADFVAMQYGLYVQDDFQYNDKLKISAGLRVDVARFDIQPPAISQFDTTLAKIEAAGYDLAGAKSGQMPDPKLLVSPRIGFNYDVMGDKTFQLRGGVGVFTSRIPFVWPGGAYTNNGLVIGGVSNVSNVAFEPDVNNQYDAVDLGRTIKVPSGEVNLFAKDFKFPQVLRASLAVDHKLPWDMVGTVEFMFTQNINDVVYYNLNIKPSVANLTGSPDDRPIYQGSSGNALIEPTYTGVYLADNTNEGYKYNFTAQLQKNFDQGFTGSVAYTFGRAMSINDGTSSQNSSQWRYVPNVRGRNDLDLGYSDYDMGHRITSYLSYSIEYLDHMSTSISLYYNGQSGDNFSYVYGNGRNMTKEDFSDQDLVYIPNAASEINLIDYTWNHDGDAATPLVTVTAAEQWAALEKFMNEDPYLKEHKGEYMKRNGSRGPFEHNFDLRIAQDFFISMNERKYKVQATLDILNLGNFLNKDWGRDYYISNGTYNLLNFERFDATETTKPLFTYRLNTTGKVDEWKDIFSIGDSGVGGSRWFAQFGLRFSF